MTADSATQKGPETIQKNRKKVLLTRPGKANKRLADLLERAGYDTRNLPLLHIHFFPETPHSRQVVMNIDQFQQVICSSQYAASQLAESLDQYWPQIPLGIHWHSLGKASAQPLADMGIKVSYPEVGQTSEDLLASPQLLQVKGQKILLVKGKGGRTKLMDTLSLGGAQVTTLELYERVPVNYSCAELTSALSQWQPDACVLLSAETLERLWFLGKKIGYPCNSMLAVIPSERVASLAKRLGFRSLTTNSADSTAILKAITENLTSR